MPWSRLSPVYDAVTTAALGAFRSAGVQGYLMCHLSHSYHVGACLYFTFAFRSGSGADDDMLVQYDVVKSAIQQAFVDNGATLSHHHAVGTEHAQWLEQDISAPGTAMLRKLGVVDTPVTLVIKRPANIVSQFPGLVDRDVVAQAVAEAR